MSYLDNFTIKLHISPTPLELSSSNLLSSLEIHSQLNSAASSRDAAPFSNSLTFSFLYSPTYYASIEKGLKVELFYELNRIGTYYVESFEPPAEGDDLALITCYDLLFTLINQDVIPSFEIKDGITSSEYIKSVFNSVGISSDRIKIGSDVSDLVLGFSVCDGSSISEILREFMLATDTYIYVDADENIQIISKSIHPSTSQSLPALSDDNLYSLDLKRDFTESPTGIKVNYKRFTIGEPEEVLHTTLTMQPSTLTELSNLKLEHPLYDVFYIKSDKPYSLDSISSTQNTMNLSFTSSLLQEDSVDISVIGRFIKYVDSFIVRKEQAVHDRVVEVTSRLIQDSTIAQKIADCLFSRLHHKIFSASLMPTTYDVSLGKVYTIQSDVKGLSLIPAYVHGYIFTISEGDVDLELHLTEIGGVDNVWRY